MATEQVREPRYRHVCDGCGKVTEDGRTELPETANIYTANLSATHYEACSKECLVRAFANLLELEILGSITSTNEG